MRPRKRILVYSDDTTTRAIWRFVLRCRGWNSFSVTPREVHRLRPMVDVDAAVFLCKTFEGPVYAAMRELRPGMPTLLVNLAGRDLNPAFRLAGLYVDMGPGVQVAEVLAQVRLMCLRRRGPKPKVHVLRKLAA